ncbi:YqjF family protein [Taibaiella chishuiensis]|uniref:DUF2071 domain-containing protein n=1 Tax=Taibaiella chishuiensis TaxID=1434707 RepID=A0A2P8D9Q3_9BACT|nr:DUF2071 domain-containing protein [Taibaiella chishuiensis]PSK93958.1 hypothetical protein B0I18_101107 [Taibaiella chishuiensis]
MSYLETLINDTAHRPWPLPPGNWTYYQEWNRALFLHWKIDSALLIPFLPPGLEPDTFAGSAWISLVAFTMEQIRPRQLPALAFLSDFHELNLRTYVQHSGKKGVYFLGIEAQKILSVLVARSLSGLPYRKASISRKPTATGQQYEVQNPGAGTRLLVRYRTGAQLDAKQEQDTWLTERYCLYTEKDTRLFRFDIHHEPWPLQEVQLEQLETHYRVGSFDLAGRKPDLLHYSPGIKVLAWHKTLVLQGC